MCKFYSKCEVDDSNQPHCVCPNEKCPTTSEPVCGDDGNTYDTICALKAESCSKKKPIKVKNQGVCGKSCQQFCFAMFFRRFFNISKNYNFLRNQSKPQIYMLFRFRYYRKFVYIKIV